ncbi:hypothetical protein [Clostridium transplantifaecale]|uniref:hypothetical protein n=1 Tax=Clostridium transplantifaecale TaxID=2479838 RepID=UPI000F6384DA|nr:hypothetical protein [Clostridium transplantifaecale]
MNQNIEAGKIKLSAKTKPALSPGTWRIAVTQEVSGGETLKDSIIRPEELVFSCEADPFTMDPKQIYSVYPPRDSFGMFEMVVPNMVLKRRTLPWERKIPECPEAPWLALLLFSEKEEEQLVLRTVRRQEGAYEAGESRQNQEEDSYIELVIPAELFGQVCPSAKDMELSVHSRFTSRKDKVTEEQVVEDWLAVVAANRLPRSGAEGNGFKNTVYLVSMEGAGTFLKERKCSVTQEGPVRLPVLGSWSFYSKKEEYNFRALFEGLRAGPLAAPIPPKAGERAEGLLEQGYVPLNHSLRDGGNSVSWYHGPFRPWKQKMRGEPYRLFSDAGLVYEPEMGMFDVSVAAAFNLGRMMALKDGVFAGALGSFREENKREAARRHNRRLIRSALMRSGTWDSAGNEGLTGMEESFDQLAARLILGREENSLSGRRSGQRSKSLVSLPLPGKGHFEFLTEEGGGIQIPEIIRNTLAKWSLLYGVPYRYLIPGQWFLPQETIRFFYMDHDWLTALLDGAMSLGRLYDVDYDHDSQLIEQILEKVFESRMEVRPKLQGIRGEAMEEEMRTRREQAMNVCYGRGPYSKDGENEFVSTGFLLRSEMVAGWRGLEFRAFADLKKTKPLVPLRLETLGPDVLLGIFAGECVSLEIGQPPEGMHFGFESNPQGGYRKLLRNLTDGSLYDEDKIYAGVAMRNDTLGVLDWAGTAENIKKMLPGMEKQGCTVTSAHMALEMIQNPATGEICRRGRK